MLRDGGGGGPFGGGSGSLTRLVTQYVWWASYVVPNGVNGLLIESCGSGPGGPYNSFTNPILGIFTASAVSPATGDCDLQALSPILLAMQDDCTADQADASIQSSCIGPINFTGDSCTCINTSGMGGQTIYIASGNSNVAGGQFEFDGSPNPIVIPTTDPLDISRPAVFVLTITTETQCISCTATCPGGSLSEGEPICDDTNDPGTLDHIGPQDLYDGGCNSDPPTFNGPSLVCSTTPVTICGKAGNFRNPFPCDSSADCPNTEPCSGTGGACDFASFINRDTDWYKIVASAPTTIHWKMLSCEFAPELGIVGDPLGDCNATFVAFDAITFPCEPPTGTQNTLEVTAAVCAGTYYL